MNSFDHVNISILMLTAKHDSIIADWNAVTVLESVRNESLALSGRL